MSESEHYNNIIHDLEDLNKRIPYMLVEDDKRAEINAVDAIRELRQIIERLRRVVGESDTDEPPRSLTDMNKLHKDDLAFVAWQFFQWVNGENCPADTCKDYPCSYRQEIKAICEENLRNGDLDEAGMEDQKEHGYYANVYCDEDGMGCWAEYYLWCYRNGYNPQTGKKNDKTP